MVLTAFMLPPAHLDEVRRRADAEGISRSALIRQAIAAHLNRDGTDRVTLLACSDCGALRSISIRACFCGAVDAVPENLVNLPVPPAAPDPAIPPTPTQLSIFNEAAA